MFRDLYKQANDEIKGDREILDRAFLQAAQPKKTKSKMKVFYSFATSAVAAVVIVGALFVNSDLFFNRTLEFMPEEKESISEDNVEQLFDKERELTNSTQEEINVTSNENSNEAAPQPRLRNSAAKTALPDEPKTVSEIGYSEDESVESAAVTFSLRAGGRITDCDDSFSNDVLEYEDATDETVSNIEETESFSYMYDKNNYIGETEGFKNVEISPVKTKAEAIVRAMEECDGRCVATEVFRDDIEKVWKVSFEKIDEDGRVTVYLDFDGRTLFIVNE